MRLGRVVRIPYTSVNIEAGRRYERGMYGANMDGADEEALPSELLFSPPVQPQHLPAHWQAVQFSHPEIEWKNYSAPTYIAQNDKLCYIV